MANTKRPKEMRKKSKEPYQPKSGFGTDPHGELPTATKKGGQRNKSKKKRAKGLIKNSYVTEGGLKRKAETNPKNNSGVYLPAAEALQITTVKSRALGKPTHAKDLTRKKTAKKEEKPPKLTQEKSEIYQSSRPQQKTRTRKGKP